MSHEYREVFTEPVATSICEYNIGSMQRGQGDSYDLAAENEGLYLLDRVRSLKPGEALVIVRSE